MPLLSRLCALPLAASLAGVEGARVQRRAKANTDPASKFIGGVPVLNYNLAYSGKASLAGTPASLQEWVIIVHPKVTDEQVHALCELATCRREGHPEAGGVPFFEVLGSEEDLHKIVKAAGGAVKFIEPNVELSLMPEYDGADTTTSWGLERIGADKRASEGEGVHVYVFDTGIRHSHQDFSGRAVPTLDISTGEAIECHGSLSCAGDLLGHGSHCAGTVGSTKFGVAPRATLHSVKVISDASRGEFSWMYAALDWLVINREAPSVASMSLGGEAVIKAMGEAVEAAVNGGVTVVVAGGNSKTDSCGFSPAFAPAAITVGSTDSTDRRSDFSNWGGCTNIWAPGSGIRSTGSITDTNSHVMSGTSMACPHVSGAAALLLERNPEATPAEVRRLLLEGAQENAIAGLKSTDVNKLVYVGAGGPPSAAPTPAPPRTACTSDTSTGPNGGGDCACDQGNVCYDGDTYMCKFSGTGFPFYRRSALYFQPGCATCRCVYDR